MAGRGIKDPPWWVTMEVPPRDHPVHDHCAVCRNEIKVMSFKGTGVCSTNCDKRRKGEKVVEKALSP